MKNGNPRKSNEPRSYAKVDNDELELSRRLESSQSSSQDDAALSASSSNESDSSVDKERAKRKVRNLVLYYEKFNDHDLGNSKSPLREKFNSIIKDLEENGYTNLGGTKLIRGKEDTKYFRAKLNDKDRLLFTSIKHNNKDAFVILEVILNHDYHKSKFLRGEIQEKIEITNQNNEEVYDDANTVEIGSGPQARWVGKFVTFSTTQEKVIENVGKGKLPLVVDGAAGSGKTSVALESLKKIKEQFEEGKILYITQSENLIKESKKIFEYEYYDEAANELKVDIPEEIEFLSVHEFCERLIGDIKGKKPINRSKFFSWFNETCKQNDFKKYKKDGDKIFEEFTAVIGAGGLLGKDGRDRYTKLGNRQSIFPEKERKSIYNFFEKYREFIEKDPEYYDTSLIAHECIKEIQAEYDAVVVDEVQDLTKSTLGLILKSLKDESKSNFLLCGDVNQVIHPSFFSVSKLKSFLSEEGYIVEGGSEVFYTLEKNYRNSRQVIELANRILHLKNYCFASEDKMTKNEEEAFFMKSDTENTGNVGFITKNKEREMAEKVPGSVDWAVLVLDDESKEDASKFFSTPLVFNTHEAKGLEFENVILYKFMSCQAYDEIWNIVCPNKEIENTIKQIRGSYNRKDVNTSRPKSKEDKSFEKYKFYMNALYVGVTRAIDSVYITGNKRKHNLLKVIEASEEINVADIANIEKDESSPEKWRDMALKLIDNGNIEQAEDIAKNLSGKGEKEYVKEIIDAFKARGYNRGAEKISNELHSFLDKDKSDGTGLVDNTKSEDSIKQPMRGKKYQVRQNQKEEVKLSNKVNINAKDNEGYTLLHKAIIKSNDEMAEYLLQHEKIDVNVRDNTGCTPLHLTVLGDDENITKLLLQHEKIDVNAKDINSATPLSMAVSKGNENMIKLFLQHKKIDVNAKAKEGLTPLYIAAQEGHKDLVELLLQHEKIDVNAKDSNKSTPLHLAAQGGLRI